ncbi:MAG: SH3 domain-containing protein [Clostridia bacterium]|nr:SH3 domain-containing protein [Clostridia bacterium]
MKRILCIALVLMLMTAVAFADVITTGNVNLRTAPNLNGGIVVAVPNGTHLAFAGQTSVDERGVMWLQVYYNGVTCWVSTRYSYLNEEIAPTQAPTQAPAIEFIITDNSGEDSAVVDLADYYGVNLNTAAQVLGFQGFRKAQSEVPNQYYNDFACIAGNDLVEMISLSGEDSGYCLFGAKVNMSSLEFGSALEAAGLHLFSANNGVYVYEGSSTPAAPFGFCVNVYCNESGLAAEYNLSTYTG